MLQVKRTPRIHQNIKQLPKPWSPTLSLKTKGPWADTKLSWATLLKTIKVDSEKKDME